MPDADLSIRKLFESSSRTPGAKAVAGSCKISSPGFVGFCREISICEPQGCVDVGVVQAAHQKYRPAGEKLLDYASFCQALTDVLLVARAFQVSMSEAEEIGEGESSPAHAQIAAIDGLIEAVKNERAADDGPAKGNKLKAYVPTYKNWMSNNDPAKMVLPNIFEGKRQPGISAVKDGRRLAVPQGYHAGHSDDSSPVAKSKKNGQRGPVSRSMAEGPGDGRLQRMVERVGQMEDERYDAMGGPAHQHSVSMEEIARKLQYMEMRLVKAEGQLASRSSRVAEVETRCTEADTHAMLQERMIAKLGEQLDASDLARMELESELRDAKKQLEVIKSTSAKQETMSMAAIRVLEKRMMTVELSRLGNAKPGSTTSPDVLLGNVHTASTEAVEAKLVANKARDSVAKLEKTITYLSTKIDKQSVEEGSSLAQRVEVMETAVAYMRGKMEAAEKLDVEVLGFASGEDMHPGHTIMSLHSRVEALSGGQVDGEGLPMNTEVMEDDGVTVGESSSVTPPRVVTPPADASAAEAVAAAEGAGAEDADDADDSMASAAHMVDSAVASAAASRDGEGAGASDQAAAVDNAEAAAMVSAAAVAAAAAAGVDALAVCMGDDSEEAAATEHRGSKTEP